VALPYLTDNTELRALIQEQIRRDGPITFARFMGLALYHPELGYYSGSRLPIGAASDYVTSPELSSIFGRTLSRHIIAAWQAAGRPASWTLVELGAGRGILIRDLLSALAEAEDAPSHLRCILVERSPFLRHEQTVILESFRHQIDQVASVESLPAELQGHVISNEFFDALPVHRVTVVGGKLNEVYVGLGSEGGLIDVVDEPSTPRLQAYFDTLGLLPGEGNFAEVNLSAVDTMRLVAKRLMQGTITTFDYGYAARDLYAPWRKQGTLLCFYRHACVEQPYQRIGRQDMTSHVDFTSLACALEAEGLLVRELVSQWEFLTDLGIEDWLRQDSLPLEETFARRRAVGALLDSAGLGRVRVLVASSTPAMLEPSGGEYVLPRYD
jgi:SAM-dependent MidA family methyltransferase